MNFKHTLSICILLAALFGLVPQPVAAVGEACFCNIAEIGATATTGPTDAASCQAICSKMSGYSGYLWATSPYAYPSSLLQCWSKQAQCEAAKGIWDIKQPAECLPGSHYCYPADTIETTLQISIPTPTGDKTTAINLGDYVGAIYNFLIGFAFVIAVVFIMIGGIQYVIGASTGEIGKAKERIKNAVIGFVLLLFAYVILFTVNPQLIKLQVPKLPKFRSISVLEGDDCAAILGMSKDSTPLQLASISADASGEYGTGAVRSVLNQAVIKYSGTSACGTTAEVIKISGGKDAIAGMTCDFGYCDGKDTACVDIPGGDRCLECKQIVPRNDFLATPSEGLCAGLDPPDTRVGGSDAYDIYKTCGYTKDPSMFSSGLGEAGATTAAVAAGILSGGTAAGIIGGFYTASVVADALVGSCVALTIDCKKVANCAGYNSSGLQVVNTITDNELYDLDWPFLGDPNLPDICAQDPCKAGPKNNTTCEINAVTEDCRAKDYKPAEVECTNPELC